MSSNLRLVAAAYACATAAAFGEGLVRPASIRVAHTQEFGASCNLTGAWSDDSGNLASMTQTGTQLSATPVGPPPGWNSAVGQLTGPLSLIMSFGGQPNITASIDASCDVLRWSNGQTWTLTQPNNDITVVHAVFMTHLDVGFTDLARNVCELYFDQHYPASIALSYELASRGGPAGYAHTTHPWLLQEFLDGATNCSTHPRTPEAIATMEAAIAAGYIRWHGKPLNNFVELEDGPWFATSLTMADALNARFGTSWGHTCKSTDVPGMSVSSVPYFVQAGKLALHIGYNSACLVPNIPPVFTWLHNQTNTSLIVYVNNNYGSTVTVPGSPHALEFLYTPDNSIPPTADAVEAWWAQTQARYPNATIYVSSLDNFTAATLPYAHTLPVVVGEIGQSWSYGAPADPIKMAQCREIRRLRNEAVQEGWLDATDANLLAYERRLWIACPEHNHGASFGQYVPGARSTTGNWSNAAFEAARGVVPGYDFMDSSWTEKRAFVMPLAPIAPVSGGYSQFLAQMQQRLAVFNVQPPNTANGYTPVTLPTPPGKPIGPVTCGRFSASFSSNDGSLTSLTDTASGYQWLAPGSSFGSFVYQTYTEWDFNRFNAEYNAPCGVPCGDFAKQGMDSANPVNKTWAPTVAGMWVATAATQPNGCQYLTQLALDPVTATQYGAPTQIYLNITVDGDPASQHPTVWVTLWWPGKTATRLAEAMWLSFQPAIPAPSPSHGTGSGWGMDVLGYPVDPLSVVDNGTRHVHAVGSGGVSYNAGGSFDPSGPQVNISSLDSFLVSPGDHAHLLWYDGMSQPDMSGGWAFNVYNNVWGTAFRQWYDGAGLARFRVSLQPPAK